MAGKIGRPKGTPKTGGRQKGSPNKVTADIKALAQSYGPEAIKALAEMAFDTKPILSGKCTSCGEAVELEVERPEAIRTAAIKELLDRGFGRAPQHHTGDFSHTHVSEMSEAELERIASRGSNGTAQTAESPNGSGRVH